MKKILIVAFAAAVLFATSYLDIGQKWKNEIVVTGRSEISVPGVDQKGNGVIGKFDVESMAGDGKIFTNIDHLLFFVDTQYSMQTARSVASNVTGIDLSNYNLVYDIDSGSGSATQVIEGPSAGAAITIATIAALQNLSLSDEVMITGSINKDGTIGRIGGIEAKAKAAKLAGAKVFLVPEGQGIGKAYKIESRCEEVKNFKVCRTKYVPEATIGNTRDGLIIKEVGNVTEALKYFVKQ